jgi:hypothetical protein
MAASGRWIVTACRGELKVRLASTGNATVEVFVDDLWSFLAWKLVTHNIRTVEVRGGKNTFNENANVSSGERAAC